MIEFNLLKLIKNEGVIMAAITDLPANVFVKNILHKLNLQEVSNLRATCSRVHGDREITKFLTAQLNAAKSIRAAEFCFRDYVCAKDPIRISLTNRQIKLIRHDWIKFANERVFLLPIFLPGLCSKIVLSNCEKLLIPVRENVSIQEIFKTMKEYLQLNVEDWLSFEVRDGANSKLDFFSEKRHKGKGLLKEKKFVHNLNVKASIFENEDFQDKFYNAVISERRVASRIVPITLDKLNGKAKLRIDKSANAVFLGITLALFAIAFLKYCMFSNFAD